MLIQSPCSLICIGHVVSHLLNHFTLTLKIANHRGQPIPPSFTDMLRRMLHLECDQRITPRALLEHPFISLEGEIKTNSSFSESTMVKPWRSFPEPTVDYPKVSSCPESTVGYPKHCRPEPRMDYLKVCSCPEPIMDCTKGSSPEPIVVFSLSGSHTPSSSEDQREAPVDTTDSGKG